MRTPHLKPILTACAIALALSAGQYQTAAQISVGPAGSAVSAFGTLPPVTSWSTRSIGSLDTDFAGVNAATQLDAAVQTNTASLINGAVGSNAGNPPGTTATAQWSSTGLYLQTRPTGNSATLLMASLTNNSGTNLTGIALNYSLSVPVAPGAEEVLGHRVYYSLTGLANSWVAVGNYFSAGNTSIAVSLASPWANGTAMYILFADDNAVVAGNPDGSYQIDNFAIAIPFPGISTQPQNSSTSPGQNVTLTVVATGAQPLFYQWRKNGNTIANATNSSYTLINAQAIDAGTYSVVVNNAFGSITSSNALITVTCSAPAGFAVPPADQSLNPGGTINLSAVVSGTTPVSYQWYRNGVPLNNATNATYVKANGQPADSGLYTLTVDNCAQLPNSASAVVSIANIPYVLVGLTNYFWKYNQLGNCLDASWRTTNYNDSAWPQGRGLLALEDNAVLTPLTNTVLSLTNGAGARVLTYYFRTQFVLTNDPSVVTLVTSNYVDDGAVYYVNGKEAFRFNMSGGDPLCTTLAPGTIPTEGVFFVSNILSSLLVQGTNTIAVEVHQVNNTSSDVVFGMQVNVNFLAPSILSISTQPQDLVVEETKQARFELGLQGQPAFYQWFRNGLAIPNATANPFIIASTATNDAGSYYVVASNSVNTLISKAVNLTVLSDTNSPTLIDADGTITNTRVLVTFSELVLASTATNVANYKITNTLGGTLTISSAVHTNGSNVLLTTTAPRLVNNNYVLFVSNVRDISMRTNAIVADSRIPISSIVTVMAMNGSWRFMDPYPPFDPDNLGTAWKEFTYTEVGTWGDGNGIFSDPFNAGNVPGTVGTSLGQTPSITSYFRSGFNLQASPGGLRFALTHIVDDGAVFYLNGTEFFRFNMPAGAIDYLTTPAATIGNSTRVGPLSLTLPSFRSGSNVLAVELHQTQPADVDKVLGMQLDARIASYTVGPVQILSGPSDLSVVEGQPATFQVSQVGGITFQWQQNNANIVGATNGSYTIANVTTNMEGAQFRVSVSNLTAGATSTNARLHVIVDSKAPALLSAVVASANSVLVSFSETMATGPAQTTANYLMTNSAGAVAAISSAVLNNGTNVLLTFVNPLNGRYVLVVNNLTDASSQANRIPANSAVTVGVDYFIPFTSAWKYLLINTNEEIQSSYFAPSFNDSAWQGPSNALLYVEDAVMPIAKNTSLGANLLVPGSGTDRINTHYFRQNFVAVVGVTNLTMKLRHVIDDGMILYLNGAEIFRFNMPAGTATAATQATANTGDAVLVGPNDVVVNLLPGNNVFAAEVHQNGATSSDIVFGIELSGSIPSEPIAPPLPIQIVEQPRSRTNGVASTAFFRSTASGTAPIRLQWYKDGAILPGATNSLLTITNITAGSMTNYELRASNSFGGAISSNAVLTVTNGVIVDPCPPVTWTNLLRFNTNSMQTNFTRSGIVTRFVLVWTNPETNTCHSNATVILQRTYDLRSPVTSTVWSNVYTNFFGQARVTNSVLGSNTVLYRLSVP